MQWCIVPTEKRKKLDPKSVKHVFVGYCENTKAYRLYNPTTKSFTISRDVIFNEEESYFQVNDSSTDKNLIFYPLLEDQPLDNEVQDSDENQVDQNSSEIQINQQN